MKANKSANKQLSHFAVAKGFTLIEIMVVVVILGILATVVVPNFMGRPDEARQVKAKQDIATIMQALQLYRLDNNRFPSTAQGLQALVTKPEQEPLPNNYKSGGYIGKLRDDPWGNAYQYLNPGLQSEVDVISYGADGEPGGEGVNADITSASL